MAGSSTPSYMPGTIQVPGENGEMRKTREI